MAWRAQAPDGSTWRVRRRWLPRLGRDSAWGRFRSRFRRTRDRVGEHADVADGCLGDLGEGFLVAIAAVLVIAFVALVGIPLLVAVAELLIVVVAGAAALLSRLLLGRPWELVATSDRGEALSVEVSGWYASREKAAQVLELLEAGLPVPGATALPAAEAAGSSIADHRPAEPPTAPPPHRPDRPPPAAPSRSVIWVSTAMLVVSLAALGAVYVGPRWLWHTSCPVPEAVGTPVTGPALPAQLVAAGPLSLDDAVGGKYGSDARRAAIEYGTLVGARYEDWLVDQDLVSLRVLTFLDQQRALDYAAADAETICTHVDSTFRPDGLPGAAGVRQPWRSGPPGWWAGVVVDDTYVRAYVRSYQEDLGASMVTDALKRAVAGNR